MILGSGKLHIRNGDLSPTASAVPTIFFRGKLQGILPAQFAMAGIGDPIRLKLFRKLLMRKNNSAPSRGSSNQSRHRQAMTGLQRQSTRLDHDSKHLIDSIIHDLTPSEAKRIESAADSCHYNPFEPSELELFLRDARIRFGTNPRWMRRLLTNFSMDGNADGVLSLRNFSQDPNLPPTPTGSGIAVRKSTFRSENYLASVGMALGEIVGYAQEKNGAFWQSLNPTKVNESRQTSESSASLLEFHTEVMFHPHMPDYVLLYGLRQDPEQLARTIVSSVRQFHRLLPLRTRDTLFQPLFKTGVDPSFGNVDGLAGTGPATSVFYGDPEDPFFRFDLDLMVGLTPEARTALKDLRHWVNKTKVEVTITPGSLLIIDNRRTVHARSEFQAHYDGRDRWLERVSVVKDLRASLSDRAKGSRIIDTDFSAQLGK